MDGSCYVHGFPLRSFRHELVQPGHTVYVLRIINDIPRTTIDHVVYALDKIVMFGQDCSRSGLASAWLYKLTTWC